MKMLRSVPAGLRFGLTNQITSAFLLLTFVIGVTGAAGYFLANTIADRIRIFSDISIPLLEESNALLVEMAKTRASLAEKTKDLKRTNFNDLRDMIAGLDADSNERLQRLARLGPVTGANINFERIGRLETSFVSQASQVLNALRIEAAALDAAAARLAEFEMLGAESNRILVDFAGATGSRMAKNEERAEALLRTSDASSGRIGDIFGETLNRSYRIADGAYSLMLYAFHLKDAARDYIVSADHKLLPPIAMDFENTLRKTGSVLNGTSRLESEEQKIRLSELSDSFSRMYDLVLGENGLFAAHRNVLDAKLATAAASAKLEQEALDYDESLSQALTAANTVSVNLNKTTANGVQGLLLTLAACVLAGFLVAVACTLAIRRRIAQPIASIASAMRKLASGDKRIEIRHIKDTNEIGDMSRALKAFADHVADPDRVRRATEEPVQSEQATEPYTEEQRKELQKLAVDFEQSVGNIAEVVATASAQLRATAQQLRESAAGGNWPPSEPAPEEAQAEAAPEESSCSVHDISRRLQANVIIAACERDGKDDRRGAR